MASHADNGDQAEHRVVDHIVEHLAASGVEYIFGVDGANIEDVFDAAFGCAGVTVVLAKHEFSAATMADGYSRAGGGVGVVVATSGGGCLNLVAGLGESLTSRVPVLALVGQAPSGMDGCGSFQDTSGRGGSLDAEALFTAVSVYCRRVTCPADIGMALREALAAARTGGPAVLLLPKDLQQAAAPAISTSREAKHSAAESDSTTVDVSPIVDALRRALGPVTIIAGEQVARDDARRELEELRSALRAWVAVVPDAKDVSGSPGLGHSSWLGVSGVMGHPRVANAVSRSAVCLLVGTRLSATARAGLDLQGIHTLSIGAVEPYVHCAHVNSGNLRDSLAVLTRALTGSGRPHGTRVLEPLPASSLCPPAHDGPGLRYRDAIDVLDQMLPDGTDVVVDAGNTGAAAIHRLPVRRDGRFMVALGMGGMGYSFGAGIGMCFARAKSAVPQRTVIVAGDGSFYMHGMELHTAVQYQLPLTVVLFNNNAHAMCVTREQLFYGDRYSYNRFAPSRLGAGLAAMFPGLPSVDVDDVVSLRHALADALRRAGPSVVSVECSADEIPPFAPFLDTIQHLQEESTAHVAARA